MDSNFIPNFKDINGDKDRIEKGNRDDFNKLCDSLGQKFNEKQFDIFEGAKNYHLGGDSRNVEFFVGEPPIKFYLGESKIFIDINASEEEKEKAKNIGIFTM